MLGSGVLVGDTKPDDVFATDHRRGHVELSRVVYTGQQISIDPVMVSMVDRKVLHYFRTSHL